MRVSTSTPITGSKGLFTSNEFPQFIQNMPYEYQGNPELGDAIAKEASDRGAYTLAHHLDSLDWNTAHWCPCASCRAPMK